MTTATDYAARTATDILDALCPDGNAADGVEVEQDWEDGTTTIAFADGSRLVVDGSAVTVVTSKTYRAAYYQSTDRQSEMVLTLREHSGMSDEALRAEAEAEAARAGVDLRDGRIVVGGWTER